MYIDTHIHHIKYILFYVSIYIYIYIYIYTRTRIYIYIIIYAYIYDKSKWKSVQTKNLERVFRSLNPLQVFGLYTYFIIVT